MRKYFFCFLVFVFIPLTLFGKEIYNVSVISGKIKLDGKLDEDVWEEINAINNFYVYQKGVPTTYKTEAKLCATEDALYLGVICYEEDMDKIKANFPDGGNLWTEDSIEFFIYPEGAETYYQFIINAIGSRYNTKDSQGNLPLWDWEAKAYKGDKYWSIEVRIPFEVLGRCPEGIWTGNICRNRCVSDKQEFCSWAKMFFGFHDPERFNEFLFIKNNEIASNQLRRKTENKRKEIQKYLLKMSKNIGEISVDKKSTIEELCQILNILYKYEEGIVRESDELSEQLKKKASEIEHKKLLEGFF